MTLLKEYGYLIVRPFILTSDVSKKSKKWYKILKWQMGEKEKVKISVLLFLQKVL